MHEYLQFTKDTWKNKSKKRINICNRPRINKQTNEQINEKNEWKYRNDQGRSNSSRWMMLKSERTNPQNQQRSNEWMNEWTMMN